MTLIFFRGKYSFLCDVLEVYYKSMCATVGLVCADDFESSCYDHGDCIEVESNEYECDCYDGYTDIECELEIDECLSNPCLNSGTCTDLVADVSCECSDLHHGKYCECMYILL